MLERTARWIDSYHLGVVRCGAWDSLKSMRALTSGVLALHNGLCVGMACALLWVGNGFACENPLLSG